MRFRRRTWAWDQAQRSDWVLSRVRETVRSAWQTTRYYREALDAVGFDPRADFSFDDFARLPILEREIVQSRRDDLLSTAVPERERQWNATGGSSGRPVEIFMGPAERGWRASGADFSMERLRVPPGVRRALLWGHHLDPVARTSLKDRVVDVLGNRAWFDCLRLSPATLRAYDAELRRYRPRCLVAYASALATLAEEVERSGRAPAPYPTRCIVTGAEKLLKEQRAVVERAFGVPVHERYGSRDVGDMGFQYDPQKSLSYRVDWALVLLEPATDAPESDILVTKLHGDAFPMIRYRTDDVGIFPVGSRPGHPAFEIAEVLGRRADRVFRRDGSWVHGIHFPHLFKEHRLAGFKVHQRADYSVDVSVVFRGTPAATTLALIRQNLESNLPGLPVRVQAVDSIEPTKANKWRPVVTDVKPGGASA
jgi:phenylacetate-CoA ligase